MHTDSSDVTITSPQHSIKLSPRGDDVSPNNIYCSFVRIAHIALSNKMNTSILIMTPMVCMLLNIHILIHINYNYFDNGNLYLAILIQLIDCAFVVGW